jgi:hypothetical protein
MPYLWQEHSDPPTRKTSIAPRPAPKVRLCHLPLSVLNDNIPQQTSGPSPRQLRPTFRLPPLWQGHQGHPTPLRKMSQCAAATKVPLHEMHLHILHKCGIGVAHGTDRPQRQSALVPVQMPALQSGVLPVARPSRTPRENKVYACKDCRDVFKTWDGLRLHRRRDV